MNSPTRARRAPATEQTIVRIRRSQPTEDRLRVRRRRQLRRRAGRHAAVAGGHGVDRRHGGRLQRRRLNGAFYAGDPTLDGVERLAAIWRGLTRQDVFPITARTLLCFLWRRDFLIPHDGIRKLVDDHIPFRKLEEAPLPVHIVTTDIISGDSVVLSDGSTADAIVASTAIPGAFSPIRYKDWFLADGAISSNTPVRVAVRLGARRLIVLPTGHACANDAPPVGAVANALHALTLLIARQLVDELENLGPHIEYYVVPPLCPLVGLALRFFATADHIARASTPPTHGWPKGPERSGNPHMN